MLHDMARMSVAAAPGTGTIALGSAVNGYQTFAAAGAVNGETFNYNLSDFDSGGNLIAWEVGGPATYSASGPSLGRVPLFSSNGNAAINASALAQVWIAALAADFAPGPYLSAPSSGPIEAWQTGAIFDNYGASGPVTLTLPPWQAGLIYTFTVAAAQMFIVTPAGSDQIGASGELIGTLGSGQLYASLGLAAGRLPGVWVARTLTGAWSGS